MIVKFFQHDIRQGLVKYIGRYILAVLIGAIACGMVDQAGEYFQQWYGQPVNMGIWFESVSGTESFCIYKRKQ